MTERSPDHPSLFQIAGKKILDIIYFPNRMTRIQKDIRKTRVGSNDGVVHT